jgi:hypothetical protein
MRKEVKMNESQIDEYVVCSQCGFLSNFLVRESPNKSQEKVRSILLIFLDQLLHDGHSTRAISSTKDSMMI